MAAPRSTSEEHARFRRRILYRIIFPAAAGLAVLCGLGRALRPLENFHPVLEGRVYRSAQLSAAALDRRIRQQQLRSILCVRPAEPDADWYQQEVALAERLGIEHRIVGLCSSDGPIKEEICQLCLALESCPQPLLVHCQSGIDRAGLASIVSILLMDEEGSLDKARAQLTIWYGQHPWRSTNGRQSAFLDEYESWLQSGGWTHAPSKFRQWVFEVFEGMSSSEDVPS